MTMRGAGFHIRALDVTDSIAASDLVRASFDELAAADRAPAACDVFRVEASPARMATSIAECSYAAGAFEGPAIVGLILMPTYPLR